MTRVFTLSIDSMRHVTQELQNADALLASITAEEERQEARVNQALSEAHEEEQEAARRFAEEETRKETMFLNAAREELKLYAETEPKAILQRAEEQARSDSAALKAGAKKNSKKVAADLLSQLTSLSFLSR